MRDVFIQQTDYARIGSYLTIAMIILIMLAPLLGGYLQHFFNWRISFLTLSAYAFILLMLVIFFLPETSQHHHLQNLKLNYILCNIWTVISDSRFMGYMGCIFLVYGGILAWLTIGPILLVKQMNLSPIVFGWFCVATGLFYMIGCLLNAKIVKYKNIDFIISLGVALMLSSGIILLLFTLMEFIKVLIILLAVGIYLTAGSFIFANAGAGALSPFKKIAGTAGSLAGFIQISGGAAFSTTLAILPNSGAFTLACTFIFCGLGAFICLTIAKCNKFKVF